VNPANSVTEKGDGSISNVDIRPLSFGEKAKIIIQFNHSGEIFKQNFVVS